MEIIFILTVRVCVCVCACCPIQDILSPHTHCSQNILRIDPKVGHVDGWMD